MDKNQRKHDLVESQSGFEINVREQPSTKKKRTLSFRRPLPRLSSPSSFSNSNSETGAGTKGCSIAASGSTSIPTTSAIPTILPRTGTTAEDTQSGQQDTTQGTRSAGTVGAITESASETRITSPKSSELWDSPPLPDYEDQKERCLQEGIDSEVEGGSVAIRTGAAEINFSSTDIKITRFIQEAEEADDDPGRRYAGSAALEAVHCQESTEEEAIVETGQPSESLTNPAHDPDCDEDEGEGVDRGEFPNDDEIQDWGMDGFQNDFGPYPTVDPVLENACPICGLDLSKLNTMTPNAHVNRCLDGVASDPVPAVLAPESEATGQTSLGNQLTSIIGTIRSAVTNFQPRLGSSTSTPAPKPSTSISKPINKWQSKRKAPRPCPFYKKMPNTSFTVDAFCYGAVEGCDAYFLSHFHSDHYGGLTSTWDHGPIYCSSITANLVISRLGVDSKYVNRLPMCVPTAVNGVTVRLMDANHCPGSVLFVFDLENPRRRYLHTGDFRACPEMCVDPILRQPQNIPIDILYLDTTYSNPRYTFPSQELVIRETANLVCRELGINNDAAITAPVVQITKRLNFMETWLKMESGNSEKLQLMSTKTSQSIKAKQRWQEPMDRSKVVICVGTYLIGKERVFKAIAKAIKSKVFVQHSKLQILGCLEDQELMGMLTRDRLEAQVHLVHMGSDMSPESLQDYLDALAPTFTRLIAIRPTGWTFTGSRKFTSADNRSNEQPRTPTPTSLELKPSFTSPMVKIYPVPYSEHSSFNELAGFVRSLNIARIIPTVGVGSENGRHAMTEWFKRWEDERRQGVGWE